MIRAELPTLLNLYRAHKFLPKKIAMSAFTFLEEVRADENHPLRKEFDRFVASFIKKIASSPEHAARFEGLKRDLLGDRRFAGLAQSMWVRLSLLSLTERPPSELGAACASASSFWSKPAASLPTIRDCVRTSIAAWSWCWKASFRSIGAAYPRSGQGLGHRSAGQTDRDHVGKDLQFIRFNGALVGGLAGLALYTAEILLKLA